MFTARAFIDYSFAYVVFGQIVDTYPTLTWYAQWYITHQPSSSGIGSTDAYVVKSRVEH